MSRDGKRFNNSAINEASKIPGPGRYDINSCNSKVGKYFVHKFRSSGAPFFGKEIRKFTLDKSNTRKITPGPGAYHIQTEFGVYDPA